jgi:glutamate-5-semialdehyde dehydrogenase
LLHVPVAEARVAEEAVSRAWAAFREMGSVSDDQISAFYESFARLLEDDSAFAPITQANAADVEAARSIGRSTTRLVLSEGMRAGMVEGLRLWWDAPSIRGTAVETVDHPGWTVEQVRAGLGVVGFVFEGRPNVFADATGVLRGQHGGLPDRVRRARDRPGDRRARPRPGAGQAGLPAGAVSLVDSPSRAAGWALFADARLALAVARGSGPAVAQLGAVARQAGVAVSLHGTGGAWMVTGTAADPGAFSAPSTTRSTARSATPSTPAASSGTGPTSWCRCSSTRSTGRRGRRGTNPKLHVQRATAATSRRLVRTGNDHPDPKARGRVDDRADRPRPLCAARSSGSGRTARR